MLKSLFKRLAAPALACALCSLGSAAANADTVSYYVQGVFATGTHSGGTETVVNTPAVSTINFSSGSSSDTLSFARQSFTYTGNGPVNPFVADGTPYAAQFGGFTEADNASITVGNGTGTFAGAVGFTLNLYQTAPSASPNNGQFIGSIEGTLRKSPTAGSLVVSFNTPLTITIPNSAGGFFPPNVTYEIASPSATLSTSPASPTNPNFEMRGSITGTPASAPLPATASMGLALFGGLGLLGGLNALRRRRLA
ncbi:MAG TPA: hypothetical protein VFC78_01980 [Tepidisphaeraceae bacterium]|nr:hypothetical protein [Tepidisphaeraceae bacterium]